MIRALCALWLLCMTYVAMAQTGPSAPQVALGQMVMEAAQREASLRAQVITLQAEIDKLKTPKPAEGEAPKP